MRRQSDREVACAAGTVLRWAEGAEGAVAADLVSALGRTGIPGLALEVAPLARHADPGVRIAVAQALGELGDCSPATVAALVLLSRDPVDEVRSWATFALADERRTAAAGACDALAARLDDPCAEVRVEAVRGLASRGNPRAIDAAFDLAPDWAQNPVFRQAVRELRTAP
ncbi:MAG TPA: HEAT repeat domain-containing protein [Solirubrobacteraceae bacterium]|nr:HEAT repeat domain-containing protein [Solirubrobacteraceae bacterium]